MQKIHDLIVYCDYTVWYYLNVVWQNDLMNAVCPYLRNQWFWVPVYLFLAIFMPINFGKRGWYWCLALIICFALSDQISAHLIKPYFHRLRPCNNPLLQNIVHIIVPCGSGYSFPSSHATNHFAIGVFSAVTMQHKIKWIWPLAIIWPLSIAYSQVYVGVHFPFDVSFGALLGSVIGLLTGIFFNRKMQLQ